LLVILLAVCAPPSAGPADDLVKRGEYAVRAAGCIGCHTDSAGKGEPFAGGRALKTPFGTYYSPNITADETTGIGGWSDQDFLRALKKGRSPDGSHYFPVFPYTSYTLMRDGDALAIKAYLFSLPPIVKKNRQHAVTAPFGWRWPMRFWNMLFFDAGDFVPDGGQDDEWNRGAYLVNALAHCGECHGPRNLAGALDRNFWMAGTRDGPEGDAVPNITPAPASGLGWTDEQLSFFLKTGTKPDWEEAKGVMGEAVRDGYKYLTDSDRRAIARYIGDLPPIEHHIGG
jgi:mono/diheme cytochrome c family protein